LISISISFLSSHGTKNTICIPKEILRKIEYQQKDFDEYLDKILDESDENCSETDDDNEFDDFDVKNTMDNRENFIYDLNEKF